MIGLARLLSAAAGLAAAASLVLPLFVTAEASLTVWSDPPLVAFAMATKIGRASCRESV